MAFGNRSWSFVKIGPASGSGDYAQPSGSLDWGTIKQANFVKTRKDTAISGSVATEFMIKWDGAEPGSIGTMNAAGYLAKYNVNKGTGNVTSGSGKFVFDHEEALAILATPRWTNNDII